MFCDQMKVYLVFILVQSILSVAIAGAASIEIFGPLVFLGVLYLLCKYKHFTIANVLVALAVVLGIIVDIYALSNQKAIKHVLVAKAVNREGMAVKESNGVHAASANLDASMINNIKKLDPEKLKRQMDAMKAQALMENK